MIRLLILILFFQSFLHDQANTQKPEWLKDTIDRCEYYRPLVQQINRERGYNLDENLVLAIMANESKCVRTIVSSDKHQSVGLMQVTPRSWVGTRDQLFDAEFNIEWGEWFLWMGYKDGATDRDALRTYNCGPDARKGCGEEYSDHILDFWYPIFVNNERLKTCKLSIRLQR